MSKTDFQQLINQIARAVKKKGVSYDQFKYITKEVRKKLELQPTKNLNKGTVKRMSEEELAAFKKAASSKNPHTALMMDVLYETAVRVAEFCALNADDIYPDQQRIIVQKGKGSKRREIPITKHLAEKLAIHLKDRKTGPIFFSQRNERYKVRNVQTLVKNLAASAKITALNVTPHTLRHTRATLLAEAGMSKDILQAILGHESSDTTEIYTKTAALKVQEEFRRVTGNTI